MKKVADAFSIPIPANTRGVPASSYGPTSPSASGTSPLASFGAHSTSPQNASYLGSSAGRNRSASGNILHSFARQLTAFLPNTYPVAEQDENGEAKAKRHGKLRILLLENINSDAAEFLKKQGYEVGWIRSSIRKSRVADTEFRSITRPGLSPRMN